MQGKQKCRILRQIRREIAEKNDIAYVTEECRFRGECRGTCPKCEAEVRYLEEELEKRRRLGRCVTLAGISVATVATLSACSVVERLQPEQPYELSGLVENTATSTPAPEKPEDTEDPDVVVLDGEVSYAEGTEEG